MKRKIHASMVWGPYYLPDRDGENYILYYQARPFAEPRKAEIFVSSHEYLKNNCVNRESVRKLVMEKVREITG